MDIKDYFQSYQNYFWEWTTDADVSDDTSYYENNLIAIPNVGAIAYRPYIIKLLDELKLQGFPPFGALLLVLYATQEGYSNLDGIYYHLKKIKLKHVFSEFDIDSGISFLENIKKLGNKYKRGQDRIVLLQTIFRQCPIAVSPEKAERMLKVFAKRPFSIAESAEKKELKDSVVAKDIMILSKLNEKFPTVQSIIEAMTDFTEIPALEEEVIQEETTDESGKEFVRKLTEEPKTFQVGSLIRRIWSGMRIPMRHLSPGEQPIGGVSDMSNKGDLSKMLLSEFANDDEIFMNRVANNEALYIQREIPPEENIFERVILIDTSLKNWGTPKVLAFASAIAIIKHPKAHSECSIFALGQNIIPISLDNLQDVIENLNHVSPVLEVAEILEEFFNKKHTEKDIEVFFITNQENLANQKLQKVIHENRDRLKFLVTTSSAGELNFYKHHKGTRKHVQKIVLPLQELWANPPQRRKKQKDISPENWKKTDVPINYPILFPVPVNKMATFLYEGEFFILSNKKQLLKTYLSDNYYNKNYYDLYKIHHGCEVLLENLSVKPNGQFALARNRQQQFVLCQFQPSKKLISKLNLNTKEYSELHLNNYNIPERSELIYFDKNFHLHQYNIPYNYKINLDGIINLEEIRVDEKEIDKNTTKAEAEVTKLLRNGFKILNNFNNIGINDDLNLVISKNKLVKSYDNSLKLSRNRTPLKIFASQNKNRFSFSEGSEIITDSRGMLTFKSSDPNIPEFYIPSTKEGFLALATQTEFGGSEYYLPENTLLKIRKMEGMLNDYLEPFIQQIVDYGTEN